MTWLRLTVIGVTCLTTLASAATRAPLPTRPADGGGSIKLAPTLDDIYTQVLSPSCGNCHVDDGGLGWSATSKQTAYDTLVNQPTLFCETGTRVIPGDPDNSLMIQALEGTAPCLDRMPYGAPPLSPSTIGVIRNWIQAGAMFDTPVVPVQAVTWGAIKSLYE